MIVVDLLRGDSAKDENALLWKNSDILTNQLRLKDVIIVGKDSIITVKNQVIAAKDTTITFMGRQVEEYKSLSEKLEKQTKKQRRSSIFKDVSSGTIIAVLVAVLVLK
jgi:hypothetical protein